MLWPQHSRWQQKALHLLPVLLASLLPLVQQNLPARRKLTQKPDSPVPLGKEKAITYKEFFGDQRETITVKLTVLEVLKGKEAQDKLLEFRNSNQDDIDQLDSKYEYHLIKVKLVYEKGDEDYPLNTIRLLPRAFDAKGKLIEPDSFPSIPKELMFEDYSLFPSAEHEGYATIKVPKDGDYTIAFSNINPVFFSTNKE